MNIWTLVLQEFPSIVKTVNEVFGSIKATAPVLLGEQPTPSQKNPVSAHPYETIKAMQRILNQYLVLNPPLVVDGIWGPKTDAAVNTMLKKYGLL